MIHSSASADGRYIAFVSNATNLVPGDTNGDRDIFVRDRQSGTTTRVSVSSSGAQGNHNSHGLPTISSDGRYVGFSSFATNLVSGDANAKEDVFVHDRQDGSTVLVSLNSAEEQGNEFSEDPSISADGRYVAFHSRASNLVTGDTNGDDDIFRRDLQDGTTERVSVSSAGVQGNASADREPSVSADGRYVAFSSSATNLVANDNNAEGDVFVRDMQSGATQRVSISSVGGEGDSRSLAPGMSADGRYVAFQSLASNLVTGDTNYRPDVFVRDLLGGTTQRVSVNSANAEGNSDSWGPWISADGRYVAFTSYASNLVAGDTNGISDVFLRDRQSGSTERVSVSSAGTQGNLSSFLPSASSDGRFVFFLSAATNLVPGDTNGEWDIFVRDRQGAPPDSDGDGVPDDQDACPDVFGTGPDGCPLPTDSDGDGVPDTTDQCPAEPRFTESGCLRFMAIGDSVTAGFGYRADGTRVSAVRVFRVCFKRPASSGCQSPNVVAYPAVYKASGAPTSGGNYAMSGASPADWIKADGKYRYVLNAVVAADPDLTALTLGANPLLKYFMTHENGRKCAYRKKARVRRCIDAKLRAARVVPRLEAILRTLLLAPSNHVVVFRYHDTVPLLLTGSRIRILFAKLNGAVEKAVAEVRKDPSATDRVIWQDPGPFDRHHCGKRKRWILQSDSCIHPNARGQQEFASALDRAAGGRLGLYPFP